MPKKLSAGDVLTALMRSHEVSGETVSDAVDIDAMQVSRIRRNRIPVTRKTAAVLGKYFGNGARFWLELSLEDDLERIANDEELQSKLRKIIPLVRNTKPTTKPKKSES